MSINLFQNFLKDIKCDRDHRRSREAIVKRAKPVSRLPNSFFTFAIVNLHIDFYGANYYGSIYRLFNG